MVTEAVILPKIPFCVSQKTKGKQEVNDNKIFILEKTYILYSFTIKFFQTRIFSHWKYNAQRFSCSIFLIKKHVYLFCYIFHRHFSFLCIRLGLCLTLMKLAWRGLMQVVRRQLRSQSLLRKGACAVCGRLPSALLSGLIIS